MRVVLLSNCHLQKANSQVYLSTKIHGRSYHRDIYGGINVCDIDDLDVVEQLLPNH
jgi:hypothetical protein